MTAAPSGSGPARNCTALNIEREFFQLGVADGPEPISDCSEGQPEIYSCACRPSLQPLDLSCSGGLRKVQP